MGIRARSTPHRAPFRFLPPIISACTEEDRPSLAMSQEFDASIRAKRFSWRSGGYRVIVSTHATLVLDVVFTLRTLGEQVRRAPASLFDAFGIRKYPATQRVLDAALACTYKTYLFELVRRSGTDYRVVSKDISALDPSSESRSEAEWGGLTGFSSKFNRVLLSE